MNTVTACAGWVFVAKPSPGKLNAHQSWSRRMFKMKLSHSCCKWLAGVKWSDLRLPAALALWILRIFWNIWEWRKKEGGRNFCTTLESSPLPGTWAFPHCFCAQPFLLLAFPHCCSHHAILLEPLNLNGFTGNPSSFPFKLPQIIPQWVAWVAFFFSPQASPFVIWSGSRFVLGRFGKGQKAGIILKSFCNLPLLSSIPKRWSAPGGAPGTAWSLPFANNCSPFSSKPQFLLSVVHGWSSFNKPIPFKFLLKTYFYCDYNLALIQHWGPGCSAVIGDHWCLFNFDLGSLCCMLVNFIFVDLSFPDPQLPPLLFLGMVPTFSRQSAHWYIA